MSRWRAGKKLGRTLYCEERCVGIVDTPELAHEIVSALNYEGRGLDPATVEACAQMVEAGFTRYRVDGMAGWAPVESLAKDIRLMTTFQDAAFLPEDYVESGQPEGDPR